MSDQGQSVQLRDAAPSSSAAHPRALASEPAAVTLRAYLSSTRSTVLVIAVAVFAMFLPVLIVPYAFSDDYSILALADGFGPDLVFGNSVIDAAAVNGRPFAGIADTVFFSAAGTIANLRFVRLVAVIGILALALLLHWSLVRSGVKRTPATLITVLVCSLPAFQVYASWTVLFYSPWAAFLSAAASVLAVSAVDAPRDLKLDRVVGAVALLLTSLLIYQPAAMFFWVLLAVALIGSAQQKGRSRRILRTHFGVAALALPLGYLVVKLGVHFVGHTTNAVRNTLTHDPVGKLDWFFREPLYGSLNLFDLTPSRLLAIVVAAVSICGIGLLLKRQCASPLLYLGAAVFLVPLSYLPNLVVEENLATFRTRVSLSSLLALYLGIGAIGIWLTARDWLRPRLSETRLLAVGGVGLAAAVSFVAASAYFAARNVTTLFAEPQMTELRLLRSKVAALPPGVSRLAFVGAGYYEGMTDLVLYDEYGLPSSSHIFEEAPSVFLVLQEEGRLTPNEPKPIVDILPWDTTTLPKDEPVVDVRGIRQFR
jgi:hypothetical protein